MSGLFPPAFFTSRKIFLPCEIILHIGSFLGFEDFRRFVRGIYPNGEGEKLFHQELCKLSTRKFEARFFDQRLIEVVYNYDPERTIEDRIHVEVESLLPILEGIELPTNDGFISIYTMDKFFKTHFFRINDCGGNGWAYGHCDRCNCEFVISWLRHYLLHILLLQESSEDYTELIEKTYTVERERRFILWVENEHEYWYWVARSKGDLGMYYPSISLIPIDDES